MAKAVVTREAVFKVAAEMAGRGEEPTIISVQEAIGGGSYSTVKRYLDEWAKENEGVKRPPVQLPEAAVKKLMELGVHVWELLSADFQQQIESIRVAAREELVAARAECAQAEQIIGRLEAANEEQEQLIVSHVEAMNALQETIQESKESEGRAVARAGELEGRVSDLKVELERERESGVSLLAKLGEMEAQNVQLREQLALVSERASSETARAVELDRRIQELGNQLALSHDDCVEANKRADQASERAGAEQARANEFDRRVTALSSELEKANAELVTAGGRIDQVVEQANKEAVRAASHESRANELVETVKRLEQDLADLRQRAESDAADHRARNARLESERDVLRNDLGLAAQQVARLEGELQAMKATAGEDVSRPSGP